ncbi:hypothetical protein PYW08_003150 [Mythimna loreyi]|uniref:Uncharacterized protein n=1 Tax=Mythimna loreyi TaxID=667449 RepID=A0ACC2QVG8_9NEOP|nr:hypothetical protein PYW08_003150 [Mythimna loreyi]
MDDGSLPRSKHHFNSRLIHSTSYVFNKRKNSGKETKRQELFRTHPLGGSIHEGEIELMNVQVRKMSPLLKKSVASVEQATDPKIASPIKFYVEPYCQVKMEAINQLKDSTRKLLYLLDNIQSKTFTKDFPPPDRNEINIVSSKTGSAGTRLSSIIDVSDPGLKSLEYQTQALNGIYIEDDDDDCSVFKRLTRKCNCLNQQEYNDFMIHFNEETKYDTSTIGEIIKNIRILKKFLYMGGTYTKNALIFLNEGLAKSAYEEKVEITQGFSHSDLCNVFENQSLVTMCISWPCKYPNYGDNFTQDLAASFLYKLARLEEGRRYLKYTSKITNDIKKVIRKKGAKLDDDILETLKATLNLMHPQMTQNINFAHYSRQNDEDGVSEIIKALQNNRKYMTLAEVFTHLDLLTNFSYVEDSRRGLTPHLPNLLNLFKQMLREYDNSEMNIIITNIINQVVTENMMKQKEEDMPKQTLMADTATEPVQTRNQIIQIPPKPNPKKAYMKSRQSLAPTKYRLASRAKVSDFTNPSHITKKGNGGNRVIVVPVEKKERPHWY